MVTLYGAGERTGVLNVESKLAKALGKDTNTLVVKVTDRDTVLNEISARIARYEKFDPAMAYELRVLRDNVKDIFNKGLSPGHDIMDQLYFLDPKTRDLVDKLSQHYNKVVTPDGGSANVVATYPQGEKDIYRIRFEDGRWTECCEEHLWKIYNARGRDENQDRGIWQTVTLGQILDFTSKPSFRNRLYVELPKPQETPDADLPIDPYVLGLLIGDGHFRSGTVSIATLS